MGADTKIQWTDYTFNPWRGCTKISPGCTHCYAETMSKRNPAVLGEWGPNGVRVIAGEAYWRMPLRWNAAAREAGERRRVFCASLADVFEDRPELDEPRQRLFDLILQTPNLDWLLLTKRPEIAREWLCGKGAFNDRNEHAWGDGWPNVWIGVSVEDQKRAKERIPVLLDIPAKVHWLSCEPMLEEVNIEDYLYVYKTRGGKWPYGHVDWVIIGGESGGGARPCDVAWIRSLVKQCRQPGTVAIFVKQLGALVVNPLPGVRDGGYTGVLLRDRKGGDPDEWPTDLRVREFPRVEVIA